MWKKLDDAVGAQPESLCAVLRESLIEQEKGNVAIGSQKVLAEDHQKELEALRIVAKLFRDEEDCVREAAQPTLTDQPSSSATMTTYTEAVNEFTKNATAFIEQLPLLTKARDAYEQAMRASAGLREVLDAGEQNLRTLMTQLEQAVNVHRVKPAPDKKNPQPAKVEAIRGTDESSSRIMTRFP
ncbi:MAG: hypothetical protein WCA20_12675 [Candidatus Sulfotelmatobacter sp.]